MGTSSPYSGPKGAGGLLPPWAEELPSNTSAEGLPGSAHPTAAVPAAGDQPPSGTAPLLTSPSAIPLEILPQGRPPKSGSWRSAKTQFGRFARSGSGADFRKASGSYVRAGGGAQRVSSSARSGRASTAAIGSFFADGVKRGFVEAARLRGIKDISSRNVQGVLADFIRILAPSGATLEQAAARKAVIASVRDIFKKLNVEENGIEVLDRMTANDVRTVVEASVANYVNERFQQVLLARVESGATDAESSSDVSADIRGYIFGMVKLDLRNIDPLTFDWSGPNGRRLSDAIYEKAYELLETTK